MVINNDCSNILWADRTCRYNNKIIVKTLTNKFFQPIRLYYIVHNKVALENTFRKLSCFNFDEKLLDWVLEYSNEAESIGLNVTPNQVPKNAQPLVIATLYLDDKHTMLIDVRSVERAVALIKFINSHIPKNVSEITHAAIYNKLITVSNDSYNKEINDVDYDEIFNSKNIFVRDPDQAITESTAIAEKYDNNDDKINALLKHSEENSKKSLPTTEKFPVHFYEEGIEHFATSCQMRQMIAMKHCAGEKNYSFYDLTQELLSKSPGLISEAEVI